MSNSLDAISMYAYELYLLDVRQPAADYDYLVSWFKSVSWTYSGCHVGVVPAGIDTADISSNNCPIPYYPICAYELNKPNDIEKIKVYLSRIYSLLDGVTCSSNEETNVIHVYKVYTYNLIGTIDEDLQSSLTPPTGDNGGGNGSSYSGNTGESGENTGNDPGSGNESGNEGNSGSENTGQDDPNTGGNEDPGSNTEPDDPNTGGDTEPDNPYPGGNTEPDEPNANNGPVPFAIKDNVVHIVITNGNNN